MRGHQVAPDPAYTTALARCRSKHNRQRVHLEVPMRAGFTDDVKPVADLVAIRDSIAVDNPIAAEAMVTAMWDAVERLTELPPSGCIVPERRARGHREIIVAPYRFVYSVLGGDVCTLRGWHGRRSMCT